MNHAARLLACLTIGLTCSETAIAQTTAPAHVRMIVGSGAAGFADGAAQQATFLMPGALAFDPAGNLYVADTAAQRIRAIAPSGVVRTIAGGGSLTSSGLWVDGGFRNGPALEARFYRPSGLAVAKDGSVYVADTFNHCIRVIRAGNVTTAAGQCGTAGSTDGPAAISLLSYPRGLAFGPDGTLYIADMGNGIRGLDRADNLVTYPFASDLSMKTATDVAIANSASDTYLFIANQERLMRYGIRSYKMATILAPYGFGLHLGHPYAVAAVSDRSIVYSDLVDGSVRYAEDFEPMPPEAQLHAQYIGTTPQVDAPLGITGRRGGFSAPMGLAARSDGRVAIADAIQRKIVLEDIDARRHIYNTGLEGFDSKANEYRIGIQGNSFLWYATGFADSIAGVLETRLHADGVPKSKRVRVASLAEPCPDAEVLASGVVDFTILIANSFLTYCTGDFFRDNMVAQSAGPWQAGVHAKVKGFVASLTRAHVPVVIVLIPFPLEVAPGEDLHSVENVGHYPFTAPGSPTLTSDYRSAEQNWLNTLRDVGAPVINMFPVFRNYERKAHVDSLYGTGDFHPSAEGRRLVGEALADYLEKSKPWER